MTSLHTDLPTTDDKLELDLELVRIRDRVMKCRTPHVLGIHGEWGSGKTSFMRQLQLKLGGEMPNDASVEFVIPSLPKTIKKQLQRSIITVWFDAWRFQNEPTPIVALLQEMRRQMSGSIAVLEAVKKFGTIATLSALDNLAGISKTIGLDSLPDIEKIEKRGQQWEKENFAEGLTSDSIREHLCKTINGLLPSKDARIIIFIDDLDRCSAKSAMRLLEGLKIYLTVPNCVFILGMNERILVDAIREELTAPRGVRADELRLRASHYLEKICTDIYRLPLPKSALSLMTHWLSDSNHRQTLQLAIGNIMCLPPNPRRIKALANQWPRFASCVPFPNNPADQKIWSVRVLITTYLHQFHRDLWERWRFDPDFWEEILALCNGDFGENPPDWAKSLKLTVAPGNQINPSMSRKVYPNPGDIDNFWIGALIIEYKMHLTPMDFKKLVFNG